MNHLPKQSLKGTYVRPPVSGAILCLLVALRTKPQVHRPQELMSSMVRAQCTMHSWIALSNTPDKPGDQAVLKAGYGRLESDATLTMLSGP
jgi:hypothetical protein